MKKFLLLSVVMICSGVQVNAQLRLRDLITMRTTIHVVPDNAIIMIGNAEVATGAYEYTHKAGQEYIMVKLVAPGYIEKTVKVDRTDRTMTYTLEVDDAWAASDVSIDLANKAMRIIVKQGMESDETWRRVIYYISEVFPNVEISDRTVGWVRSAWNIQNFNHATIRTRIELKEIPGQAEKTFSVTLFSETASKNCGLNDQCFSQWDRALKVYLKFMEDFTNVLRAL